MSKAENKQLVEGDVGFARAVALGLVLSVGFLIGAVAFTAKWISMEHDKLAERNSVLMVEASLDALRDRMAALVRDYSFSDDHYESLLADDQAWLYKNIGAGSVEDTAIEMSAHILAGHDQNQGWSFLMEAEAPTPGILDPNLASSLNGSLPAGMGKWVTATAFELVDGQVWLFGISRVGPFGGHTRDISDIAIPRLVLGSRITKTVLRDIEGNFLLRGIDLSFDAPKHASFLPLQSSAGETVGYLSWIPPTPGAYVLQQLPAPVLGAVGFVAIFLLFGSVSIYGNARKLVAALGSARTANRHKDEFIATISHELRTPLTSISASVSLLAAGVVGQLPAKAVSILEICSRNTKVLSALIEDLLLIGTIDSGSFRLRNKPTEMNAMLQTAVENFRGYASAQKVTVDVKLEEQPVSANIDERRMSQVISNILSNAAKFSPAGAVVRAEVRSDAQKVRLLFADQGIGIPEGRKDDVFGRFRQVDTGDQKIHYGSGLGMSIARDIMKASSGTIDYTSELGVGTCFFIEVDRCDVAAAPEVLSFTKRILSRAVA